jgi:hypothetical protein
MTDVSIEIKEKTQAGIRLESFFDLAGNGSYQVLNEVIQKWQSLLIIPKKTCHLIN